MAKNPNTLRLTLTFNESQTRMHPTQEFLDSDALSKWVDEQKTAGNLKPVLSVPNEGEEPIELPMLQGNSLSFDGGSGTVTQIS